MSINGGSGELPQYIPTRFSILGGITTIQDDRLLANSRLGNTINFRFSLNPTIHVWVTDDQNSRQLIRIKQKPLLEDTFHVTREDIMYSEDLHETISTGIISWPVSKDSRDRIITGALRKSRELLVNSEANHVLDMCAKYFVEKHYVFTMRRDSCMIPATDSSIESLKKKKIGDGTNRESCSICMDEFHAGCEAVCMPCSHEFHDNCIRRWLRSSHYCPLCRYEMPTN